MKNFNETNLVNLFWNRAYQYESKAFLYGKSKNLWKAYSWDQLTTEIEQFSLGLKALGIGRGDKVSLISENRPEWVIMDLAIQSLGAIVVPIYANSNTESMANIIKHSDSKMIIFSKKECLLEVQSQFDQPKQIMWVCLEPMEDQIRYYSYEFVKKKSADFSSIDYFTEITKIESSDIATIVYTSGTTGEPKGVMLTHQNILSNVLDSSKAISINEHDISLSILPLSHMFERTAGLYCMMNFGAQIYYAEDFNKIAENLVEVKPTILICVPRVLEKFYSKVTNTFAQKNKVIQTLFAHALKTKNPFFK